MTRTASPPSDPRLRLYRFVFEHARDATIVYDADGRPILLNRAARELPAEAIDGLFSNDSPQAAQLASFRVELATHGHAHTEICLAGHAVALDAREHGEQHVVTIRDLHEWRTTAAPGPLKVDSVVAAFEALLGRVAGPDIVVELELGAPTRLAMLDREHLEHALLNLTVNARDAMPRGGHLTLRTALVTFDESEAKALEGAAAGAYVALRVTDTGVGMTSEDRERLFAASETGGERPPSATLGLAAVRRFVAEAGGCIAVHSEENRGTTVAIYFPALPPGMSPRTH